MVAFKMYEELLYGIRCDRSQISLSLDLNLINEIGQYNITTKMIELNVKIRAALP